MPVSKYKLDRVATHLPYIVRINGKETLYKSKSEKVDLIKKYGDNSHTLRLPVPCEYCGTVEYKYVKDVKRVKKCKECMSLRYQYPKIYRLLLKSIDFKKGIVVYETRGKRNVYDKKEITKYLKYAAPGSLKIYVYLPCKVCGYSRPTSIRTSVNRINNKKHANSKCEHCRNLKYYDPENYRQIISVLKDD